MSTDKRYHRTISVARLATVLDVPAATIRGWIARGQLPSVKVFGRRLVHLDVVEHLLGDVGLDNHCALKSGEDA